MRSTIFDYLCKTRDDRWYATANFIPMYPVYVDDGVEVYFLDYSGSSKPEESKTAHGVRAFPGRVGPESSMPFTTHAQEIIASRLKVFGDESVKQSLNDSCEAKLLNTIVVTDKDTAKEQKNPLFSAEDGNAILPDILKASKSVMVKTVPDEWFLRAMGELRGLAVCSASAISRWKTSQKLSFDPFKRLMSLLLLAPLPLTSASPNGEKAVDSNVDIDVSFLKGTFVFDFIFLVMGVSLIGAFGWLVGFKSQMATTAALWLLAIISFTWYLSEEDNR